MDELLPYYNRELAYIRKLGNEFAGKHPKIAARLRLSSDMGEDPHVARLVESFAFLNARIRRKVDDEFPEITKSLLGTLYPHFLAPFPSCCVVQMTPDEATIQSPEPATVQRGAVIETEKIDREPCLFRTCYPVTLWPIRITEAALHGPPIPAPKTAFTDAAAGAVKIRLETLSPKVSFSDMPLQRLRVFLHGQHSYAFELYERLLNNSLGVAIVNPDDKGGCHLLESECIQPVGFSRDEGLLDYSARSFLGYRLIAELFAFPEKFLFVDFVGISESVLRRVGAGNRIDIVVFLDQSSQDLERNVDRNVFQLGCTPVVNLFRKRAEPIRVQNEAFEYRVVPDARRPKSHEVFSVDRVVATSPADETVEFLPLYSIQHGDSADQPRAYWHMSRRPSISDADEVDHGTELFLSLTDLNLSLPEFDQWIVDVQTTCLNRDLPGRLPFGGGQPRLQFSTGGAAAKVTCLTPPTKTRRPALGDAVLWRLVSMLSLNHLSLVDGEGQGAALREVLALHDLVASNQTRTMIDGLAGVESRRVISRAGGAAAGGFCRGVEVTLKIDDAKFTGGGLYLFASVIDRFLGMYATINSFTQTRVVTTQRETPLCQWPPRAADQVLV